MLPAADLRLGYVLCSLLRLLPWVLTPRRGSLRLFPERLSPTSGPAMATAIVIAIAIAVTLVLVLVLFLFLDLALRMGF